MTENEDIVQGYRIKQSRGFDNNRGFVIAENPGAPSPFVTWQYTEDNGSRDYYWGHYFSDERSAVKDYENRVSEYMADYGKAEGSLYRYYSAQRPIDIGTLPKTGSPPVTVVSFESRAPVERGRFMAWGYAEYLSPLTETQIDAYELRPACNNPDRVKLERQARIVGKWEQAHRIPDARRLTWWYPDFGVFVVKEFVTAERLNKVYGLVLESNARAAEKRSAPKSIKARLAETENHIQDTADVPVKKHNGAREER